ncbi:hypothetical protein N9K77_01885 [bacterium]|nr:hypothetical protein [bacterium]
MLQPGKLASSPTCVLKSTMVIHMSKMNIQVNSSNFIFSLSIPKDSKAFLEEKIMVLPKIKSILESRKQGVLNQALAAFSQT